MRDVVTSEQVAVLARLAGFGFGAARCDLLAPQLTWFLGEAAHIDALDLAGEEPVISFRPAAFVVGGGAVTDG